LKNINESLVTDEIRHILTLKEDADLAEYLSVAEFCKYFSLSEQTVARWLRNGELPGIKIGKLWRISRETVAAIERGELQMGPKEKKTENDGEG
jgi:excisionase family DNA binding protein